MKTTTTALAAVALSTIAAAQVQVTPQTMVFTGRFNFTSADANATTQAGFLREYDKSFFTPGIDPLTSLPYMDGARSARNTTAYAAYHGDPTADGASLNFFDTVGVSGSSDLNFDFAGCFVKRHIVNDKAEGDPTLAYLTVRDHDRINNGPWRFFSVNDGGTARVILPGDFFRYQANGNVEFFITQALLAKACTDSGPGNVLQGSADALAQDDQGNLYLSPGEAGCSVPDRAMARGVGSVYAQNGAIYMIPASEITYGADGNVVDVTANSAVLIFNETLLGPLGSETVRSICTNAQALRASGSAFTITTDLVGMEVDPNGGTIDGAFPEYFTDDIDPLTTLPYPQAPRTIPNVLMAWDDALVRSVLSTAPAPGQNLPGSVAVINGAEIGSYTVGPDGSQLGCDDTGSAFSFTPTLMGFNLIDQVTEFPGTIDIANDGNVDAMGGSISVDLAHTPVAFPSTLVYPAFTVVGPVLPGYQALSITRGATGAGFRPSGSAPDFFLLPTANILPLTLMPAPGYLNITSPIPTLASGLNIVVQAQAGFFDSLNSRLYLSEPCQALLN